MSKWDIDLTLTQEEFRQFLREHDEPHFLRVTLHESSSVHAIQLYYMTTTEKEYNLAPE